MPRRNPPIGMHPFIARMEGRKIIVTTNTGQPVTVTFAGTSDNRTVYAFVDDSPYGPCFIGGWTCARRKGRWPELAASINTGNAYAHMNDLPRTPGT